MYERITKRLFSAESVAVFMHINPDGDCVGSSLAMYAYLKNLGKTVDVYVEKKEDIRENLRILPNIEAIGACEGRHYDLGIALDCGSASRMGNASAKVYFDKCDERICFDHHETSEPFADETVFENVAATAQILYKFFKENDASAIDKDVATCLYAGLLTDTGAFAFSNTSDETLRIALELRSYGIDAYRLLYKLVKEERREIFELRNRVLGRAKFFLNDRMGLIAFMRSDFEATGTQDKDTEGIINSLINIEGVKIAVSVAEMADKRAFKVGIRTKDGVHAGKYAALFGGGGHANASGCRIYADYDETVKRLTEAAKLVLDGDGAE